MLEQRDATFSANIGEYTGQQTPVIQKLFPLYMSF